MRLICLTLLAIYTNYILSLPYMCSFTNFDSCTTRASNKTWNFLGSVIANYENLIHNYNQQIELNYPQNYQLCMNNESYNSKENTTLEINLPDDVTTPINLCFRMKLSFKSVNIQKNPLNFFNQSIRIIFSNQINHSIQATCLEDENKIPKAPSYSLSFSEIFINEENIPIGPFQDSIAKFQMPIELQTSSDLNTPIKIKGTIGSCIHEYEIEKYNLNDEGTKKCPMELTFPNLNSDSSFKVPEYRIKFDKWNRIILLNGKSVIRNDMQDNVKKSMLVSTWRFDLNKVVFSTIGLIFGILFIITMAFTIALSKRQTKKALKMKRMEILNMKKNNNLDENSIPKPSAPPPPPGSNSSSLCSNRNNNTFTIHSNHEGNKTNTNSSGSRNNNDSLQELSIGSDSITNNPMNRMNKREIQKKNIPTTYNQPLTTQQSLMQLASAVKQQNRLQTSSNRLNHSTVNNDSFQDIVSIHNVGNPHAYQPKVKGLNRHSLLLTMNDQNEIVLKPTIEIHRNNNDSSGQINEVISNSSDIPFYETAPENHTDNRNNNPMSTSTSSDPMSDFASYTINDKTGSNKSSLPPPDYEEAVYMPSSCQNL